MGKTIRRTPLVHLKASSSGKTKIRTLDEDVVIYSHGREEFVFHGNGEI